MPRPPRACSDRPKARTRPNVRELMVLLCMGRGVAQLLNCSNPQTLDQEKENNINTCAKLTKKLLRVFHFGHFAVVNSSAEKYCMHVEFWALWIKILHVRYGTVRIHRPLHQHGCVVYMCTHIHVQLTQRHPNLFFANVNHVWI